MTAGGREGPAQGTQCFSDLQFTIFRERSLRPWLQERGALGPGSPWCGRRPRRGPAQWPGLGCSPAPPTGQVPTGPLTSSKILLGASQGGLEEWALCPRPPALPSSSWDDAFPVWAFRTVRSLPFGVRGAPHILYRTFEL